MSSPRARRVAPSPPRSVDGQVHAMSSPSSPAATLIFQPSPGLLALVTDDDSIHWPITPSRTHRSSRRAGDRSLVELASRRAIGVPAPRLRAVAPDGAQSGPHAVGG